MARIRTVKPEFYRHEELFSLEKEHKLPIRLAFSGLWCISDREGRFKWKPNQIKLDILPYDVLDMEEVLNILADNGFVEKYEIMGKKYAYIPSWNNHQIPNRSEPPSEIPSPTGIMTIYDRPPTQSMRINIYKRDNYTCVYCNENLIDKSRAICLDHVVPYIKNGTNREQNLVTSCKKCNAKKGDKTPSEANMIWPDGIGEVYFDNQYLPYTNNTVNTPLTHRQQVPDKEREGNGKGNKERERFIGKEEPVKFDLELIYKKDWEEYKTILNGQASKLSEIVFIKWKEFVDFIKQNNYDEIFRAKFVSPIDFGILLTQKGFLPDKWKGVIEGILATGVTQQQNLFFRIPQYLEYENKKHGTNSSSNVTNRNSKTTLHTGNVGAGTFGKL